ncbi:MAG: TerC family protein [Verrucomicrobiae bacterium]|nr:TerC family protein [Verrucomicrobiae bacterium]
MPGSVWKWILFNTFVVLMLALDLGVFHRRTHTIRLKEALAWSAFWIVLALLYNIGIYFWLGKLKALEFLTGYLLEKSLSVDNIFVFIMIFAYFRVPAQYQHKVLFWGILGALIMRGIFILLGVTLIQKFAWMTYVFGAILIYSGIKMGLHKEEEVHPEHNPVLRLFRRAFPITPHFEGDRFWVRRETGLLATPLMVVLIVVETTDVVFAVDSIPAVLAITHDPFIVYTSNVFAILGLRALYFALAGIMSLFHFLHYGLSVILGFVGVKMFVSHWFKIPIGFALGFLAVVLTVSVLASLIWPHTKPDQTISMQSP